MGNIVDIDYLGIKCPKCQTVMTIKDFVGMKYDNGYVRYKEERVPIVDNPKHWEDYKWQINGYTKSNKLFLRCKCGANIHVDTFLRVMEE